MDTFLETTGLQQKYSSKLTWPIFICNAEESKIDICITRATSWWLMY